MKIIRDINSKVINIGEWDYCYATEFGENGDEILVATNPMPSGATESEEEVITGWDGGLYVDGDLRAEGH